MELNFNDFQRQDVKFDINELQKAYKEILKINIIAKITKYIDNPATNN